MENLELYRNDLGNLIAYALPGGYPVYYLSHCDDVLCPDCATADESDISAAGCNYEDPHLYCDDCGERIESAYADDEQKQPLTVGFMD